jgi:hypothetical protein
MSGKFISTGNLTNDGNIGLKKEEIERLYKLKIKSLVIHSIPLSTKKSVNRLRTVGTVLSIFTHPMLYPTLCHIAIQLNMENDEIIIIEYGQYLTKKSEKETKSIFASSSSSGSSYDPRRITNNGNYWYINKDGVRLAKLGKNISDIKSFIAYNFYGEKEYYLLSDYNVFNDIDCDINNKITLGELCDQFKGEKWEAQSYNVALHNCQSFAAKIIKILKAIRINENDKIRTIEKASLPNCIISALWDNEKLSFTNTMGRIPIIGLYYDIFHNLKEFK